MPMYVCACPCGARETIFRRVDDRDLDLPEHCGTRMQRIIVAPAVRPDLPEPYESPKSGKWITSRAEQREDLVATGSFLYEPGVRQDIARRKKELEAQTDQLISTRVDETIGALSASGRL